MAKGNKETEAALKAKQQLEESLENHRLGKINPHFAGLKDPVIDNLNPVGKNVDDLAKATLGEVPDPSSSSSAPKPATQSKKEVEKLVTHMAGLAGYLLTASHYEDLYILSTLKPLDEDRVWMYLRGAMRSSQISVMENLGSVVKTLESLVAKNQNSLMVSADSNKQVSEKLSLISTKIDNVTPSVNNVVIGEFKANRIQLNSIKAAISSLSAQQAIDQSKPTRDLYPGTLELTLLFQMGKFSPTLVVKLVEKYITKITWAEYEEVVTGKMRPEEIREKVAEWKKTKLV